MYTMVDAIERFGGQNVRHGNEVLGCGYRRSVHDHLARASVMSRARCIKMNKGDAFGKSQ